MISRVLILSLAIAGTASPASSGRLPIDQVPMYGGMDRAAVPSLEQADEDFIRKTAAHYGGREKAAVVWIEQGFRFYEANNLAKAMARFNQAWLLDPNNPQVYWGFGAVLHDRNQAFAAYDMLKRAHALGFRDPGFLADLGKAAAIRIVERPELAPAQKADFIAESEAFFADAVATGDKLGYIHGIWAAARFWQGDYPGAWEKVAVARRHGHPIPAGFISKLSQKMPEPQ